MTDDIFKTLPSRRWQFHLEKGYHTDLWFTLDALFVAPHNMVQHESGSGTLLGSWDTTGGARPPRIQPLDAS